MAEYNDEQVRKLREKFANTVLILHYNFPLFKHSVHYWRAIYSRVFEIIEVVSGERGNEALNVTGVRSDLKLETQKIEIMHFIPSNSLSLLVTYGMSVSKYKWDRRRGH